MYKEERNTTMKRILAAALALTLLFSLAGCGEKETGEGTIREGLCYEATGISPDAVAMTVDGIDIPMDLYFYNLCYAASYLESYMQMYGLGFDWTMELSEGVTILDAVKDSALENTKSFAVFEALAKEYDVILDEDGIADFEAERANLIESFGGEESFHSELEKVGLTVDSYDRMIMSDYLYNALDELAATEGSRLYPSDEQLLAYAAETGFMTADHILLLTKDMSTYESLDDETIAEKKALAEELKAKLDAYTGDDLTGYFTSLADEYSEDSGRASNPLGYTFGSGQMVAEFEDAAAALDAGEVSEIVESYYGYHIILRKPLDEAATVSMVRDSYFSDFVADRVESASVTLNPALEALDVPAVYSAFYTSVSATAEAEDGTAAEDEGSTAEGDTTDGAQDDAEN